MQIAGQPYHNYAVQGVMMLQADIFGPAIPTQYETATQANPDIKTVVMTGGGNDILQNPPLLSNCRMDGDQCKQTLAEITQAFNNLWTEMADDGRAEESDLSHAHVDSDVWLSPDRCLLEFQQWPCEWTERW